MGYIYADGILRALAGVPRDQVTPVRLVDASNWGTSADAREQFDEKSLADLTLAIVAINGWNRLSIAFATVPGSYRRHEARSR